MHFMHLTSYGIDFFAKNPKVVTFFLKKPKVLSTVTLI
jgi:hypothetical protein